MTYVRQSVLLAICTCTAVALLGSPAVAHPDDPKVRDTMPAFNGPAWRSADGGVAGTVFSSEDVTMQTWLPVNQFGSQHDWASDCWGYTSPSGREYAIIGLSHGTAWVDVTDPGNAQVIDAVVGPSSIWRDIKTHNEWAYIVSEGGNGIQVVEMTDIDNTGVSFRGTVTTGGSSQTHNVAINEESGYLYRVGGGGNGLRIYDLNGNPEVPAFVGEWNDRYIHDAVIVSYEQPDGAGVGNVQELAFCCSGFNNGWVEPGIDVLDVSDKNNIVNIERYLYPMAEYSHQAWLSQDRHYLFLNDEKDEDNLGITSTIHVIDVSDPYDITEVSTFTNGSAAITHNLYIKGDKLYSSNYRSGLRIFDISDPLNANEIAYFDTYPGSNASSFNGLWSNYPYFQSNTIIGSDREKGLFVWTYGDQGTPGNDADVNDDGTVNVDDLVQIIVNWGPCPPPCPSDIDNSGVVDVDDLVTVILGWS